MMTIAQFIRRRKEKLEAAMTALAFNIAGGGLDYEGYLINVGKFRQMKSERDGLADQLQRMSAADDETPDDEDPEEIEEPVSTTPARRPQRPRAWGGR